MMRRMRCQRSSIVTARSSAFVDQAAEAWHMDHGALTLVVLVGVEPEPIEGLTARRAAVPLVTAAVDPHHLAPELRVRIEALSLPEPAVGAEAESVSYIVGLPTGEHFKLGRGRIASSRGEVANHEVG